MKWRVILLKITAYSLIVSILIALVIEQEYSIDLSYAPSFHTTLGLPHLLCSLFTVFCVREK